MKTMIAARAKAALGGLLFALSAALSSTAADLRVPADYPTIQAAVNAAQSNDTVRLAPGVYSEQVTVLRKHLALLGSPGTVLRAKPGMAQTLTSYDFCTVPLLGVAMSDVTIKGISFEGEHLGNAYPCTVAAIIYSGSSGAIEECSFSGFRGETNFSGLGVVAANNSTLVNNRFCNVTNPIVIEPPATNIVQQGTLTCPFPPPPLTIARGVILSWPGEDEGWAVESALNADGPWTPSDATPLLQDRRQSVAVPTDHDPQYFRLRRP